MDASDWIVAVVGVLVGALAGPVVLRALEWRGEAWSVSPPGILVRWRVWRRHRRGEATVADVGAYLQSSLRGLRFLGDASRVMGDYRLWWGEQCGEQMEDRWLAGTAVEREVAGALLTWLRGESDWDLLVVCLEARLTPAELVAHVTGRQRVSVEQVRTLAALRSEGPVVG